MRRGRGACDIREAWKQKNMPDLFSFVVFFSQKSTRLPHLQSLSKPATLLFISSRELREILFVYLWGGSLLIWIFAAWGHNTGTLETSWGNGGKNGSETLCGLTRWQVQRFVCLCVHVCVWVCVLEGAWALKRAKDSIWKRGKRYWVGKQREGWREKCSAARASGRNNMVANGSIMYGHPVNVKCASDDLVQWEQVFVLEHLCMYVGTCGTSV